MSSISVIIPAYNAEKYIGEAIESALNQTRPAKEIIVVDDASTDRTAEIARSFGERVKVLVNEVNSGPGHSRNAGVAASTGDYLAFLDADDKWLPVHLENLAGLLDKWPEAGFACCALQQFGGQTAAWLQYPECQCRPANIFAQVMRRDALFPSTALVRGGTFNKIGGFDEITRIVKGRRVQVEDYDFFLRLSAETLCVSSKAYTALYRVHENQASIFRTEQILLAFAYRKRCILKLRESEIKSEQAQIGLDQMRHAWDGHLREGWQTHNQMKLRAMLWWGVRQPELARSCWYYIPRALLPKWGIRIGERLLRKEGKK